MYAEHVPLIAAYAAQSPGHCYRVARFVVVTTNRHFEEVPRVLRSIRTNGVSECPYLMQWQKRALFGIWQQASAVFDSLARWQANPDRTAHTYLRRFAQLPGLGIIKAGFLAQLIIPYTPLGCLDRQLVRLYGLALKALRKPTRLTASTISSVNRYIHTCRELGGSQALWDTWCAHMATLRPYRFADAETVSRLHVECIVEEDRYE